MKAKAKSIALLRQLDANVVGYLQHVGLVVTGIRGDVRLVKGADKTADKARLDMSRIPEDVDVAVSALNRIRSYCQQEVQNLITGRPYGVYVKGDPRTWE